MGGRTRREEEEVGERLTEEKCQVREEEGNTAPPDFFTLLALLPRLPNMYICHGGVSPVFLLLHRVVLFLYLVCLFFFGCFSD